MKNFKIRSNKRKRIYTIFINGCRYRTLKLTATEFKEMYYFTEADWRYWLRTNDYYYIN